MGCGWGLVLVVLRVFGVACLLDLKFRYLNLRIVVFCSSGLNIGVNSKRILSFLRGCGCVF